MRSIVIMTGLLVAATTFAQTKSDDTSVAADPATVRYEALQKKVDDAFKAWRQGQIDASKKAREAAGKGGMIPAMSMVPPYGKFVPDYQEAAKEFAGKDGAIPFLLWISQYGSSDASAVKQATGTLMSDHIASEKLTGLARALPRLSRSLGAETVTGMFDTLVAKSPHASVRGWATLGKFGPTLEDPNVGLTSAKYTAAKATLVKASSASKDDELMGLVRGLIADREKLGNGQVAPDIAGVDLDGVKFKLSDYEGKIVMLDFWGDW